MIDPIANAVEHPFFTRAKSLAEPWRTHFPKSVEEAQAWRPWVGYRALSSRVLVVASTRIEIAWAAYCDAVPGDRHEDEIAAVLSDGVKAPEMVARALFPQLRDIPYAE